MKREAYVAAILRQTGLDGKTIRRIRADLETDIDARLDAGESMDAVRQAMGSPAEVAESLVKTLGGAAARKSPWRWALLAATALCVLLIGFCIGGELWISELEPLFRLLGASYVMADSDAPASVGVIGGSDGPTAVYVTSMVGGLSRQIPVLLGFAFAAFGGFLLLQWRGSGGRARFLVLGAALCVFAAALAITGIGMWVLRGMAGSALGWWFITAAVAQLVVGVLVLRLYVRARRKPMDE